jgi:hypothetical protein
VSELFSFPNPVNELAARTVAGGVAVLTAVTLGLSLGLGSGWLWLTVPLAYGFLARVVSGPTLTPLGQLASRVVAPRLGAPRLVPGPPKRFAQLIGATLSVAALVAHFGFGADGLAQILVGGILVAATLESGLGLCLGCVIFARLMRAGLVPAETCAACADVSLRQQVAAGPAVASGAGNAQVAQQVS